MVPLLLFARLIPQTVLNSVPIQKLLNIKYMKDKMVPLLVFVRLKTQTILNSVPMLIVLNIEYMRDKMVCTTRICQVNNPDSVE